jgi:hypothetical protein
MPLGGRAVAQTKAAFVAMAMLLASLLAGCGGGGGGDGGGGGGFATESYSVSPLSFTFNATQGGATPAAQVANITVNSGSVFVGTLQNGSGFTHAFQITGQTTGTITVTPDAPNTAGTFTGTIVVRGCRDQFCAAGDVSGSPKTINVTYTVAATVTPNLTVAPASLSFTANAGAATLPASQDVSLSLTSGSLAWNASAVNYISGTAGWLNVSPTSGTATTTPQAVTFSVNTVPAAAEVRTASVTFTAGAQSKTVNVSYTTFANAVNFVAPYVATTGVAGNVVIRGHGFSNLDPATTTVQFGAAAPGAATVVSDTEIRVAYPALPAGAHTPAVTDGSVLMPNRPGVQLVVVDAPVFAPATVVRDLGLGFGGAVASLIYDAERRAVLLADRGTNKIYRYTFSGGTWSEVGLSIAGVTGNLNITLSPDGTKLLQSGSGATMIERDPVSVTDTASVSAASFLGGFGSLNMIAFANDGGAIGNVSTAANGITLFRYDLLTQQFSQLSQDADMVNRTIAGAADGDILVMPSFEPLSPAFYKPIVRYDATGNSLSSVVATTGGTEHVSIGLDSNASKVILVVSPLSAAQETRVYDSSFGLLGTLPVDLTAFAISPDGNTAWAYFPAGSRVRRFNLNAPDGIGGFAEVGTGTVVASPGSFFSKMVVSPDGGTLFLAGNDRFIVLPAP